MKRYIACFLILILSIINLMASYPFVRNFSRNISKSGTQNWDITQHENDWMYFANNKGLLEFDGSHWTLYTIRNQTPMRCVYYDKQNNRIYTGAFKEFGYYERNKRGILTYHSLSDRLIRKNKHFTEIWKIHKLDGKYIFQTDQSILVYENNQIKIFPFGDKINKSEVVYNKLILAGYKKGANYFDGHRFIEFPNAAVLKNKKVCAILPFKKNQLLFFTDFHGIYLYDGEKVSQFKTDIDEFLYKNQVFCATIKNEQLAIGTVQNGLIVKNLNDNSTIYSNVSTGLQNNTILSIAFDRLNNLWLGLDKGIDYVMVNSAINDLVGNSNLIGTGYTSLVYDGKLYLGTNQGLYTMNLTVSKEHLTNRILPVNKIKGQIWSLNIVENKLFCSGDQGLYIIDSKKIEAIEGLRGVWVVKQIKSHPDVMLGLMYNQFFILKRNNGKWKFSNNLNGFNEIGNNFYEDRDGEIWMVHSTNGVYCLTLNENLDRFSKVQLFTAQNGLPTLHKNSAFLYKDQIVLCTENGFYQYNKKEYVIEKSTWFNKLFGVSLRPMKMYFSKSGDIWSVTDRKVKVAFNLGNDKFRVDSVSFYCLNDKLNSGFEHIGFLDEKKVVIATENGFSLADVNEFAPEIPEISKIALINITFTNLHDSLFKAYQANQNNEKTPEFENLNNSVRFEYICTEFRNENSVQYSYILENYDKIWSDYSDVNIKEFSKLPSGTYTFRVKARNLYTMQIVETSYRFRILPPWYLSIAAIIIYLIMSLLGIYLFVWFIQLKTKQAARRMEIKKEHEIKEKELKFKAEAKEKENEIIALKNQKLQYILRHKSQDLASSTMSLIRKNEILQKINLTLTKIDSEMNDQPKKNSISKNVRMMQEEIKRNVENDNNWTKFQENFDIVYENYLKRITEQYPHLTIGDKKLCAYLKMDLSSKDIAPLQNTTFQSVEMSRHRLRKKLNLERDVNLKEFLQNF